MAAPVPDQPEKLQPLAGSGADRDTSYPAISPSTGRTDPATGPGGHRQEILRPERRRVSRVGGRRDSVRDRAVVTPPVPYVLNACATALGRCRGNKCDLKRGTQENLWLAGPRRTVNSEAKTCKGSFGQLLKS